MKWGKFGSKAVLLLFTLTVIAGFSSASYLVNSQQWQDVYSGTYKAYSDGESPYFVRSSELGVLKVLPFGEDVDVIESLNNPMASNLEARLETRGYTVGDVTSVQDSSFELRPENKSIVVVPEDYPAAALAAAPYARVTDSWVLFANEENADRIEEFAQDSDMTMIGTFGRDVDEMLSDDAEKKISSPNKFNLSVKVAKAYMEEKDAERVIVASGDYISKEAMEGESPVLITGRNFLPDTVRKFLFEDPDHDIEMSVVIGNRMTNIGQEIRDQNITRNGEETDEKINVFIKYGQARGNSGIYGISLFPLPTGEVSLSIPSVRYDPAKEKLYITYRNSGESRMYQLTTFRILNDGDVTTTGGDEGPVFVGGDTGRTVEYGVNLTASEFRNAQIEFSTAYGTTPESLDTYLTEEGTFSPPLTKNLTVSNVSDSSNVSLESVAYLRNLNRFKVKVENPEEVGAYASVRLTDVMVQGEEQSFNSERKKVAAGETESFYIVADLDRIDLDQNDRVNTVLTYGEENSALINSKRKRIDLEVRAGGLSKYMWAGAAVVVILILIVAVVLYSRRRGVDPRSYLPSR